MKFFLSLLLFWQVLFGVSFTYPDFKQIYNRNIKSIVYFGKTEAIAVSKHYAVSYQKKRPDHKYVKFDPFLDLYLFYSKKELKPIEFKDTSKLALGEWLASIGSNSLYIGNFAKKGSGIDMLYSLNSKVEPNSMITCLCYKVYGIGVGNGKFIPSRLITRFIKSKNIYYGSIGARFEKIGEEIYVTFVNPFHPGNKLKVGDIIRKIDGKRLDTMDDLERYILFSHQNKTVEVEFTRNGIFKKEKFKIYKRKCGGELSDTFLESEGMYFDKKLNIKMIEKNSFASKYGLKVGDKLLQVDGKSVKNQDDVKRYLSKMSKKDIHLLFDRNDFQFFVKVSL
ncbi:MAG: PDZ domain-containing protein [Sulfurospirillaceae bacterium]|nr:PDZ domain-containing protein [Sulfurospirillaceae bacterium]